MYPPPEQYLRKLDPAEAKAKYDATANSSQAFPSKRASWSSLETNMSRQLTAVIQREGDGFVALCPELDIASQGDTVEAARDNLHEALELFFECASPAEVQERLNGRSLRHAGRGGRWVNCQFFGQEACRILERHGFVRVRSGDHIVMQRATAAGTTTCTRPRP